MRTVYWFIDESHEVLLDSDGGSELINARDIQENLKIGLMERQNLNCD